MTLQAAANAKTASDGATLEANTAIDSLVMGVIDTQITTDSTRIDRGLRTYRTDFDFEAEVTGDTVQVIQSDRTKVLLIEICDALTTAGYRTSFHLKPSFRVGVADRVHLAVAWD